MENYSNIEELKEKVNVISQSDSLSTEDKEKKSKSVILAYLYTTVAEEVRELSPCLNIIGTNDGLDPCLIGDDHIYVDPKWEKAKSILSRIPKVKVIDQEGYYETVVDSKTRRMVEQGPRENLYTYGRLYEARGYSTDKGRIDLYFGKHRELVIELERAKANMDKEKIEKWSNKLTELKELELPSNSRHVIMEVGDGTLKDLGSFDNITNFVFEGRDYNLYKYAKIVVVASS